jgi:uncharacterized protein with PIN domain
MPSSELRPEMKTQGFIMDKYLSKVGKMLWNKGFEVTVVDTNDGDEVCAQAIKENRIFLTNNLKISNKKVSVPRGCLHFKAPPHSKQIDCNNEVI